MSSILAHPVDLSASWQRGQHVARGAGFVSPALAAADGRLHVVWQAGKAVVHSQLEATGWPPAERICGGAQPHACAGPGGDLHILFSNDFSGRFEIYHCVWNGRYWSLPLNISFTPGASWHAQLLFDAEGREHAVWEDHSPGYPMIYYGRRWQGWRWQGGAVPHAAGRRPAALFDGQGRLHLAYQTGEDDLEKGDIYYTMLADGQWASPQLISSGEHPAAGVRLAIDDQDRVHAVWREQQPHQQAILYASGLPGQWVQPQPISPALLAGGPPGLAVAQGRFLHSVWPHTQALESAHCDLQQPAWQPPELAAAESAPIGDLALTVDAGGRAHVAWVRRLAGDETELCYGVRESVLPHRVFLPWL